MAALAPYYILLMAFQGSWAFPVDTHKLIPYQKYSSILGHGLIKSADDY